MIGFGNRRGATVVASLTLAAALAGCGGGAAGEEVNGGERAAPSFEFGGDALPGLPHARPGKLAVFARRRRTSDIVPRDLLEERYGGFGSEDSGWRTTPALARSRLLVAAAGDPIYVIPSSRSGLCVVGFVRAGASCRAGFQWAYTESRGTPEEDYTEMHGLVPNGVERVEIVLDNGRLNARVSTNGFYALFPRAAEIADLRGLVLHRDGAPPLHFAIARAPSRTGRATGTWRTRRVASR